MRIRAHILAHEASSGQIRSQIMNRQGIWSNIETFDGISTATYIENDSVANSRLSRSKRCTGCGTVGQTGRGRHPDQVRGKGVIIDPFDSGMTDRRTIDHAGCFPESRIL